MIDLNPILEAIIGLGIAIIAAMLAPWLRARIGEARWAQLLQIVDVAVRAAEQIYEKGKGAQKLEYALSYVKVAMKEQKLTFGMELVRAAIEAAVLGL